MFKKISSVRADFESFDLSLFSRLRNKKLFVYSPRSMTFEDVERTGVFIRTIVLLDNTTVDLPARCGSLDETEHADAAADEESEEKERDGDVLSVPMLDVFDLHGVEPPNVDLVPGNSDTANLTVGRREECDSV